MRDCPPDWISAIADHYPELVSLVIEWQRGSGDYLPMEDLGSYPDTFAFADDDAKPTARKKASAEQVKKIAEEMGALIWDAMCSVCDAEGPVINFALIGLGMTKDGGERELFRIARKCDLRGEQGLPLGGADGDNRDSDANQALRWSTTANRDVMNGFIKLTSSVADPIKEVSSMIRDAASTHRAAVNGLEDVVREKADMELQKLRKQLSLKRLAAAERLARHGMDLLGADIGGHLLHLAYLKYGGEPAPVSCMEACAELAVSFPVAAKLWLDHVDENLGDDLMHAFASGAQAPEEQHVAATFMGLRERLSRHSEGVRGRLRKRARIVWHVLRGRLLIYQVEI